jgi:hypothetical protein
MIASKIICNHFILLYIQSIVYSGSNYAWVYMKERPQF